MPLLTVGIPVFNGMPYLKESVQSILTQTYENFELLIVNDGSTDGSLEYLKTIRDPRLRVIHQTNRGLTATLNRMMAEANSPWLVRHDADDVAFPHRLSRIVDYIYKYPRSGMFCSLAEYYPEACCGRFRGTNAEPEEYRKLVLSGYLPTICHPTVTLNVNRAIAVGGYRFDLYVEDIDLWWRMALACDIRLIPEVTVGYRQNSASVTSANLARQALNTRYVQYLLLSHLWNLEPLPYEEACLQLDRLTKPRSLQFKTHLRQFNIEMGQGHRLKALGELGAAFLSSPQSFALRTMDEVDRRRIISIGENPESFAENQRSLWPHSASDIQPMLMQRQAQMILDNSQV